MKDIIRRILSALIALGGFATMGFYLNQGTVIVKQYVIEYNYYILAALGLVFLLFFLQFALIVFHGKWLKARAIVLGLITVLISFYCVDNNAAQGIFAGDILSLLGVLMIYMSLGGLIVTKKAEKEIASGKQMIIEV